MRSARSWSLITALGVLVDGEADGAARPRRSCRRRGSAQADEVGQIVYQSFGSYFAGSLLVAVLNGMVILTDGPGPRRARSRPSPAIWSTLTNFIPQIGGFLGGSFFVLLAAHREPGHGA